MSEYLVSESKIIDADAQRLFDIVADPTMHPVMDGSGTVRATRAGAPQRLSLGARFGMDMKLGAPYRIVNTVVEFDEPRLIAWRHFGGHRWRYLFEPVEGGTRVTEEWDARPSKVRVVLKVLGVPGKSRVAIRRTLERLADLATT